MKKRNWDLTKTKTRVIFSSIFILVGLVAGYFYYIFFGCKNACTITSSPTRTMIYFAVIFALLSVIFWKDKKKNEDTTSED
jgi:membrane associated rhomboid family serine protease